MQQNLASARFARPPGPRVSKASKASGEERTLEFRVGLGHDLHRLATGRKLVLAGVPIEFERGLAGHSDADVVLHAVTDAVLGAAGLGDIGQWFPDTDAEWADADSSRLLAAVVEELHGRNWQIVNVDCTVSAEQPKLSPYKREMEKRLSELLGVTAEAVNVKAKTGERVGPVGRQEAIAADAVVLIARDEAAGSE